MIILIIINYAKDYPNTHYYAKAYHMQWAVIFSYFLYFGGIFTDNDHGGTFWQFFSNLSADSCPVTTLAIWEITKITKISTNELIIAYDKL